MVAMAMVAMVAMATVDMAMQAPYGAVGRPGRPEGAGDEGCVTIPTVAPHLALSAAQCAGELVHLAIPNFAPYLCHTYLCAVTMPYLPLRRTYAIPTFAPYLYHTYLCAAPMPYLPLRRTYAVHWFNCIYMYY